MCSAHAYVQANTHTPKIKINQSFERIVFETGFYVTQAKLKIVLQLMACKGPEKHWVWALLKPEEPFPILLVQVATLLGAHA